MESLSKWLDSPADGFAYVIAAEIIVLGILFGILIAG